MASKERDGKALLTEADKHALSEGWTPKNNEELEDRSVTIDLVTDAPRGVTRAEFYIDGQFLGSDTSSPFRLTTTIPSSISRGVHTLKAIAYDDIDNAGSDTVNIEIRSEATNTTFELIDPKNGQDIQRTKDLYTVVISLENPDEYSIVSLYADPLTGGQRELAGQITNPSSPFLTIDWALPASGTWALSANAKGADELTTAGILVKIIPIETTPTETNTEGANESEANANGEAANEESQEDFSTTEIFTPDSDLNIFN